MQTPITACFYDKKSRHHKSDRKLKRDSEREPGQATALARDFVGTSGAEFLKCGSATLLGAAAGHSSRPKLAVVAFVCVHIWSFVEFFFLT